MLSLYLKSIMHVRGEREQTAYEWNYYSRPTDIRVMHYLIDVIHHKSLRLRNTESFGNW